MKIETAITLAVVGVVGFVAWRTYRQGQGTADAIVQWYDQQTAEVQSAVANNITGPWERGQVWAETGKDPMVSSKAWLYSDYGYTGVDSATGTPVIEGEWYSDPEARRYEIEQRRVGQPPAATSIHGAAFGIYPRP